VNTHVLWRFRVLRIREHSHRSFGVRIDTMGVIGGIVMVINDVVGMISLLTICLDYGILKVTE
jgi:hypothetical protein